MATRLAVRGDADAIVSMGHGFHAESPVYSRYSYDPEILRATALNLIDGGAAFVAEEDGCVVGFMLGAIATNFFGPDQYGLDVSLYVQPGSRGRGHARGLIAALEAETAARGADEVFLGISTGINEEATEAFYHRLGYQEVSVVMRKILPATNAMPPCVEAESDAC